MNMSAIPFDRETPRISVSGRSRPTARFQPQRPNDGTAAVGCKPCWAALFAARHRYIGDVRHRDASRPVAVVRSRSARSRPSCP